MAELPVMESPTISAIEAAVAAAETRRHDQVVRASIIGKCERHQWYRFRWAHAPEQFDPRILRLFDTGHIEEARMVVWLQAAGVTVLALDPATGEQWEVSALGGHFKGHLDGIATGIVEAPATPHLLECKTHNAKSFGQLVRHGVAIAKPDHVAQMQIYMHLKGLKRAYYLAKNKDTDELWAERIEYDPVAAAALLAKAERIAFSTRALARVSEDPEFYLCRFCSSRGLCHEGQFADRNCRTCLHATPQVGGFGAWFCERHKRALSDEDQAAGCPSHLFVPDLVPGEQYDADPEAETVSYHITHGDFAGDDWIDGYAGQAGRPE